MSYELRLTPITPPTDDGPKTFASLTAFVWSIYRAEGGKDNEAFQALCLSLANEALVHLAERTQCYEKTWTSETGGGLTLTGYTAPWPDDFIAAKNVWFSDVRIAQRSTSELDAEYPTWRTMTGAPRYWTGDGTNLYLSSTPLTGTLKLLGFAYLPEFSATVGAFDPLALLQARRQMAPADYILANLPVDPENPMSVARQQKYAVKWEQGIGASAAITNRRRRRTMSW